MPRFSCRVKRRRNNSAVSEIVGTVLMIGVTVALGSVIFAYATNGFSNTGSNFLNLASNAVSQINERFVVEQVTFSFSSPAGASLYVRDFGQTQVVLASVYVTNATTNAFVKAFNLSPQTTISSGAFAIVALSFTPDHAEAYSFTLASTLGTTVIAYAKAT